MCRGGKHVDVLCLNVDRQVSDSLHRVGVEENAVLPANLADLGDWLNGADLVVGGHDRDEAGVLTNSGFQLFQADNAVFVNGQKRDLKAVFFQFIQRVEDRVVLKRARYDMGFALFPAVQRGGEQRLIVRFASARGEDDLPLARVDDRGDLLARFH